MPAIGGHLPDWLNAMGIRADLRCTFYVGPVFVLAACFVARRIHEPGARQASELMRNLPRHLARRKVAEVAE